MTPRDPDRPRSRRGNGLTRCAGCRMHESLCVCSLLPRLETRTRLALVLHRDEQRKPTNTGQLAASCLVNSVVHVRGRDAGDDQAITWSPGTLPLLLFPHEGARPLAEFAGQPRPVTLLVPDGTWRQASKVRKRVPGLADVACVSLPPGEPSRYRLREEHLDHGLSTLEAIARALEILEGPGVRQALERVLDVMVERSLWSRGTLASGAVTGGIPPGAMRHDTAAPRGG